MSLPPISARTSRGASCRLPARRNLSSPANSWLLKREPPMHPLPISTCFNSCSLDGDFFPCYLISSYQPGRRQFLQSSQRNRGTSIKPLCAAVSEDCLLPMQDANPTELGLLPLSSVQCPLQRTTELHYRFSATDI